MSEDGVPMRKLRVHKRSSQQEPYDGPSSSSSAALSSRVSELIPGIADLSLSSAEQGSGPLDVASAVVQRHQGSSGKMWLYCLCVAIAMCVCVFRSHRCHGAVLHLHPCFLHTHANNNNNNTHSPRTSTTG